MLCSPEINLGTALIVALESKHPCGHDAESQETSFDGASSLMMEWSCYSIPPACTTEKRWTELDQQSKTNNGFGLGLGSSNLSDSHSKFQKEIRMFRWISHALIDFRSIYTTYEDPNPLYIDRTVPAWLVPRRLLSSIFSSIFSIINHTLSFGRYPVRTTTERVGG